MSIRALCFDLDGTLLDTIEDLADSMNAVLRARQHPEHPLAAYKHFVGEGIEMLVRRALPSTAVSEVAVATGVEEMKAAYSTRWAAKTKPYAGIAALLDALAARGSKSAILSNKPDHYTQLTVELLLAPWSFEIVRGAREGVPKKPDPTALLAIIDELAVPPAQWLYVGDTATDMHTAKNAGLTAVGVLWGFRGRDELEAAGADHIVKTPAELLALL